MARIAINGLGRIGRAVLKIILDDPRMEVVGANDLLSPDNLAYLLKFDSVYGRYHRQISVEGDRLRIGERSIRILNSKDPSELPWKDLKVDIALECTGKFTTKEGLEMHLKSGARYAILSAPSKSQDMKTIVPGVNEWNKEDSVFSLASCTTNCIAPVVEIMHRRAGVEKALLTTIHAYTSSQSIVDGPSKKWRRGRAGAINLVPATTGAAKATTQAIPDLQGLFDGLAVRAPVPVGSVSDLVFVTKRPTTVEEVNTFFRQESESSRYRGILGVSDEEIVSSDIIQDPHGSLVDLTMTTVVGGNLVKVLSWYDNEWGYASQMVRQVSMMSGTLGK